MTDYTHEDRHCPECGESFGFPADDVDVVAQAGFRASAMHDWSEITERGREAWRHVAHRQLSALAKAGRLLPEATRRVAALNAEADRVHALGGDYNEAVAAGLRAAAWMIAEGLPEDARTEWGVKRTSAPDRRSSPASTTCSSSPPKGSSTRPNRRTPNDLP